MIIKNGNVFCPDCKFQIKDLYIARKTIVDDKALAEADGVIIDATDKYIIPGLVDIHSHGAASHDFCDADEKGLTEILRYERSCGITSYCPTSMTFSFDILKDIFDTINRISFNDDLSTIDEAISKIQKIQNLDNIKYDLGF